MLPLERQAGVDAVELRRQFPKLCMVGHYDKMVMNRGEAAMRAEFERLAPATRTGGFIPSVHHQTPPGVSLPQYRAFLHLLEEIQRDASVGLTIPGRIGAAIDGILVGRLLRPATVSFPAAGGCSRTRQSAWVSIVAP